MQLQPSEIYLRFPKTFSAWVMVVSYTVPDHMIHGMIIKFILLNFSFLAKLLHLSPHSVLTNQTAICLLESCYIILKKCHIWGQFGFLDWSVLTDGLLHSLATVGGDYDPKRANDLMTEGHGCQMGDHPSIAKPERGIASLSKASNPDQFRRCLPICSLTTLRKGKRNYIFSDYTCIVSNEILQIDIKSSLLCPQM